MKFNKRYCYLYGAGGHGRVILDILNNKGIKVKDFIDENNSIKRCMNVPVIHSVGKLSPIIVSVGNNEIRKHLVEELTKDSKREFISAISPASIVSDNVKVGDGTVIMQGSVIQSCSSIGKHCIINTSSSIDHDCSIGDYVHVSPNATLCGGVEIGEGTWIGAGSVAIQGVKIGKWCVIGAGSVIVNDIPDRVLAFGNPCKIYKKII